MQEQGFSLQNDRMILDYHTRDYNVSSHLLHYLLVLCEFHYRGNN